MNTCPYCGLERSQCGSVVYRTKACGSVVYRSKACFVLELDQLQDRVKRLESAGDLLAEWHLAVVTTREKAERDVARWNEAKGEKP